MTCARTVRLLLRALVLALLALTTADAGAQPAPVAATDRIRPRSHRGKRTTPGTGISFARASRTATSSPTPTLMKKLSSGLPMVIAMRAYVYREGADTPVALAPRVCRVVYDLWDEVYRVHISEPERERDQAAVLDGVLRLCTEARDLPVVRRGLLTAGAEYFLGVVVDVNPVSQEMIEQMRRWMSRPTGSTGIGPTDALFGNFVQLFVKQIATSDKTLTFRTQSVVP